MFIIAICNPPHACRLTTAVKQAITADAELLGKISKALGKSVATIQYRWLPDDNELLTLLRIQAIIKSHLHLPAQAAIVEPIPPAGHAKNI